MAINNYYPPRTHSPIVDKIPDNLPDYTQAVFTPREQPIPEFKDEMAEASVEFFDEPDYTQEVAQGIHDVLNETPRLTRSEAEEQMHLVELRRLAEAYTENDARVISEVMAKKYPMVMFAALNNEYFAMKQIVDTVTGAVKDAETTQ